jgi:hypothetical protein
VDFWKNFNQNQKVQMYVDFHKKYKPQFSRMPIRYFEEAIAGYKQKYPQYFKKLE